MIRTPLRLIIGLVKTRGVLMGYTHSLIEVCQSDAATCHCRNSLRDINGRRYVCFTVPLYQNSKWILSNNLRNTLLLFYTIAHLSDHQLNGIHCNWIGNAQHFTFQTQREDTGNHSVLLSSNLLHYLVAFLSTLFSNLERENENGCDTIKDYGSELESIE